MALVTNKIIDLRNDKSLNNIFTKKNIKKYVKTKFYFNYSSFN
ncbi:hypothetical protein Belba_3606 [Belliella baltica DSM 15883]|uniref:Uncharacterized protein n=1 Tax=Belliella baltica (strain DSM 15883 / CIP 108006 / LMG 21964 / BA134) TaxID=866536 RepID=I3ZA30_BELBD|nr:hypothetical protein Belba_3606 [Belliella baltica DSM 15883]